MNLRQMLSWSCLLGFALLSADAHAAEASTKAEAANRLALLTNARRIMFLGDSITANGQYVAFFDAWLQSLDDAEKPAVIDAGLPSETVSGLSEQGHAGGKFPRPDLFERLDRVLPLVKPDLVFACYGINCGIYEPFDEERFAKYQKGMQQLKAKVEGAGAKFIVVTPPFFDDQRGRKNFSYNEVLDRYSAWLVAQRANGWNVIDLHSAMNQAVAERRKAEPKFTFQPDAVHPNPAGHWFMASELIRWFGDEAAADAASPQAMLAAKHLPDKLLPLVQQRVGVLRDAYVGAAGHKRPGVAKGLPIDEAEKKAAELTAQIKELAKPAP